MARDLRVRARIEAEDNASTTVNRVRGAFKDLNKFLDDHFAFTLGDVRQLLIDLGHGFEALVGAATESEAAVNLAKNAMGAAGTASAESLTSLREFASVLQHTTGVSDELVLQQFALARSFTSTNREAANLVRVAQDFAVGSGRSFEEAVRALGAATNGVTRDVQKFVPEIAKLTDEQLKAGEATRLIGERFAGLAAGELNTLGGQIRLAKENTGELAEAFAAGLTGAGTLEDGLKNLNAVLGDEGYIALATKAGKATLGFFLGIKDLFDFIGEKGRQLGTFFEGAGRAIEFVFPQVTALIDLFKVFSDQQGSQISTFDALAARTDAAAASLRAKAAAEQSDAQATAAAVAAAKEKVAAIDNQKSAQQLQADEIARANLEQKAYNAALAAYIKTLEEGQPVQGAALDTFQQSVAALNANANAADRAAGAYNRLAAAAVNASAAQGRALANPGQASLGSVVTQTDRLNPGLRFR